MFKKIVSHLPFSPSLIGELSFYAKRLQKEEMTRRFGLVLTAIALIIQSLIVFTPPESANAANAGDLVYGGIHSRSRLLSAWDNNTQGFADILRFAGITRDNLASAKDSKIHSRVKGNDAGWQSWNRVSRFGLQRGEVAFQVGDTTLYSRPLAAFDVKHRTGSGSWYPAFVGTTAAGKPFAIMKACANVLIKELPPRPTPPPPTPTPITVCELATKKIITLPDDKQFDIKLHSKNLDDCKEKPKPIASCSQLHVKKLSRTKIELQARANVQHGATVKSYTYTIVDAKGKELLKKTITSSALIHQLEQDLPQDGQYTARVAVDTSTGSVTSHNCQTAITIEPIARCPLNPALAINDPLCQPCPADETIWVKHKDCTAKVIRTKAAKNLATNADATKEKAKASQRIEYTLTAKNEGKAEAEVTLADNLADVLEYASLYDRGDGVLNEQTKVLSWPKIKIAPGQTHTRTYVVQIASRISPMPQGASDPTSHDCRMTNTFGNTIDVFIDCPAPKTVEQVVTQLPKTGPGANITFAGVLAAVVTFFYLRARQLNKEVRLIRRNVTAGTL